MSAFIGKTPNQAWKEYRAKGGTLDFTNFLHRTKEKYFSANGEENSLFLYNSNLNDTVQTAIKDTLQQGGLKTEESGKTVFGINKTWLIVGSVVAAAGIAFLIYKNVK